MDPFYATDYAASVSRHEDIFCRFFKFANTALFILIALHCSDSVGKIIAAPPAPCQSALFQTGDTQLRPEVEQHLKDWITRLMELTHKNTEATLFTQEVARYGYQALATSKIWSSDIQPHLHMLERLSKLPQNEDIETFIQQELQGQLLKSKQNNISVATILKNTKSAALPFLDMHFIRIPRGSFQYKGDEIHIHHDFEVMDTKVTQDMWTELMGENCSHFMHAEGSSRKVINGFPVSLCAQHPVESLTWWSTIAFANKVSKKMGLEETYDLSNIRFRGTPEKGNFAPTNEEEAKKLKIRAPDGDIHQAKGFRLGTTEEFLYLLSNLGNYPTGPYRHGISENEMENYAWLGCNSHSCSFPVATTARSFTILGQPLHDLIGNVYEWKDNIFDENAGTIWERTNKNMPLMLPAHWPRSIVGHSFSTIADDDYSLDCDECWGRYSNYFHRDIGFRLTRTLR